MTSFINKLFRKKAVSQAGSATQGSKPENNQTRLDGAPVNLITPAITPPQIKHHLEIPQLLVGVGQSVGIQRDHNEDSLFTLTTNLGSGEESLYFGLYVIADGMGGHENGELASSIAVGQLTTHVINSLYLPIITDRSYKMDVSIQEVMHTGVIQAHQKIKQIALGAGTTLTAALILGEQMTIAHVGDSRAYSIDPLGKIHLLTHDHSLVKRLEEIGQISAEQASTHPQRNVLYQALGQGEIFEPDIKTMQLQRGSQLIICTDGLWGVISENELVDVITSAPDPQLACQALVYSANSAGGPDNISVILVRMPE